MSEFN